MLNANYLLARLREGRAGRVPAARLRPPAACTSSSSPARPPSASSACKTLDVAKRLLDYGFHPPTIYFPLLVDEALMFEPTETETREALDELAEAIDEILAEAESDPEIARNAPYTTPVRRLDEARRAAGRSSASRSRARGLRAPAAPASAPAPARTGRRARRRARSPRRLEAERLRVFALGALSTSSHSTGVEAVGRSRARSE